MNDQATTYPAILGHVFAKRRRALSLDQRTLADALSIAQPSWSRIERGEVAINIEQLACAARTLKTTPSELIGEADRAAEALKNMKIDVQDFRPTPSENTNTNDVLVAAALGALIAFALSR